MEQKNKKTGECVKCRKRINIEDGVKTSKGLMCKACLHKRRKRIIAFGIAAFILIFSIVNCYLFLDRVNHTKGFEGVKDIQDSTTLVVNKPHNDFHIDQTVAQSSPVVVNSTVDNIDAFKRALEQNINNAELANEGAVVIPNISVLFELDSSNLSEFDKNLLKEYAQAYLRTNKQAVVLVEGYACNLGDNNVNELVSKMRSETVKSALVSLGLPVDKVEIQWYGKSRNSEFSYPSISEYRRVNVSIK